MSMNVSNYSQFYRGTEKINQYGAASTGGKDTLVRYEFNTTDANGNKIMDQMSREETLQAIKEISSQYGDNVIVEFSGDGMAMLAESRKGQLDEIAGANRAEKQAQFNNDVVQLQDTYRKVEGKVEDSDDFHTILKANDPELAQQIEEMNMRIINHKPGDSSNAKAFNSLMKKAMGVVNAAKEKDNEVAKSNTGSARDMLGTTVEISEESRAFLDGVEERKAAQQAAKEAARQAEGENVFAGTGDMKKQYLVFSENLYNNGFYDNLSDDEVREMEDLLKDITSGMDSLNRASFHHDWQNELSHEAAKLEFASSINALNYFADKYVPEEMRESFKDLIKQYESYNSGIVAAHKSIYDMRDESMADLPAPNAVNVSQKAKESQEEMKASREIGRVKHTNDEEKANTDAYKALFDKLMQKQDSIANIFGSLQNTMVNHASGNSKNSLVLQMLHSRNSGAIKNMKDYWSRLL